MPKIGPQSALRPRPLLGSAGFRRPCPPQKDPSDRIADLHAFALAELIDRQEPLRLTPSPSILRRPNGSLRPKALFLPPQPRLSSSLPVNQRAVVHPERVVCCVSECATGPGKCIRTMFDFVRTDDPRGGYGHV